MKKLIDKNNLLKLSLVFFVSCGLNVALAKQSVPFEGFSAVDPYDVCHNQKESRYVRALRVDRHIPCDCKPFNIHQFKSPNVRYIVFGINSTKGANEKIDLNRDEARALWKAFSPKTDEATQVAMQKELASKSPRLADYIEVLDYARELQGFSFGSEGDVLEALVIAKKEEKYALPYYFVTGGISYGKTHTEGELDLVVFERVSCAVIEVGEAKLSSGTNDARKQLARFRKFVN